MDGNLFCSSPEGISTSIYNNNPDIDPFYNSGRLKINLASGLEFISELCNKVIAVLTQAVRKKAREVGVVCGGRKGKHGVMAACRTGRGDELGRCSGVIGEQYCVDMQRDENR